MQIAAQLYTVRDFLQTEEDIAVSLKKIKDIGYNTVQISGMAKIDNEEVKRIADNLQLTICATHVNYKELTEQLDEVIERHKVWDCKYVGLGSMPKEFLENKEGYLSFAKTANEIGRKLKNAGIQLIYHNHNFEYAKYDGKTGMDILMEALDPEFVQFELDVYWVQAGGANPIEWIHKLNGRLDVVHLKDMIAMIDMKQRFAEVGEGNMNFVSILKACEEIGVKWAAVEQDTCYGNDPFECLAQSLRNLKRLGAVI